VDFADEVKAFGQRVAQLLDKLQTEEATKHALVLPFLQLLGYNVFDPSEVVPEFTADVGVKKNEKVDYAIFLNGRPAILIEAKPHWDDLSKHGSQLYRYFSVTEARFAILTNGIEYKFFSDLQEPNKMDDHPFLEFNLLDPKDALIAELKKFHKENFDPETLFSTATVLKYTRLIRQRLQRELKDPSDEFLRFWLKDVYAGRITQNILDQFRPIVRRALTQYINDLINERLQYAIQKEEAEAKEASSGTEGGDSGDVAQEVEEGPSIVTTQEELEAFFIVKTVLRNHIDPSRITYKDNVNYMAVLLDENVRKWICRFYFYESRKYILLHGDDRNQRRPIDRIDDLYNFADELVAIARQLAGGNTEANSS